MLYTEYLKKLKTCPFCGCKDRMFISNTHAFLTYARAPYAPYHLLVVPKRHVISLLNLTKKEQTEITKLLHKGILLLRKIGQTNCSVLVRQGNGSGKSIKHLHYHLIPRHRIGDLDARGKKRRILTDREIKAMIHAIQKL